MSEVQKNWRNLIGCVARFPIGLWFSDQSDSLVWKHVINMVQGPFYHIINMLDWFKRFIWVTLNSFLTLNSDWMIFLANKISPVENQPWPTYRRSENNCDLRWSHFICTFIWNNFWKKFEQIFDQWAMID